MTANINANLTLSEFTADVEIGADIQVCFVNNPVQVVDINGQRLTWDPGDLVWIDEERLTTATDVTNGTYSTTYPIEINSIFVFYNGVKLAPGTNSDYTLSANTITFNFTLRESQLLTVKYLTNL